MACGYEGELVSDHGNIYKREKKIESGKKNEKKFYSTTKRLSESGLT